MVVSKLYLDTTLHRATVQGFLSRLLGFRLFGDSGIQLAILLDSVIAYITRIPETTRIKRMTNIEYLDIEKPLAEALLIPLIFNYQEPVLFTYKPIQTGV